MEEKTHNQELRAAITQALLKESIEISDVKVPLLGSRTRNILLECRDGEVSAIMPEYKAVN